MWIFTTAAQYCMPSLEHHITNTDAGSNELKKVLCILLPAHLRLTESNTIVLIEWLFRLCVHLNVHTCWVLECFFFRVYDLYKHTIVQLSG